MSIHHAILGLLSRRSLTGYDLKKIVQDSSFMPWTGNNNQIYTSLVELHKQGFLTQEVQHGDTSPSKKIYTITAAGLAELKIWSLTAPEPPEFKKLFLVQLAWSGQLNPEQLEELLQSYEGEVEAQIRYHEERRRRDDLLPGRDARETLMLEMIYENAVSYYEQERDWTAKLRRRLAELEQAD